MHRLVLAEFRPFSKHYPGPFKFKSQIPRSFIPQISISRPLLSYQPITSTAVMSTMKALVMQGGTDAKVVERSLPKPRSKFVGVKVNAVALNPTDWKHIKGLNQEGLLVGCDFAGTVEKTGEGYNTKWSVGDRICGFVHGGNSLNKEDGAFAEHIMAGADLAFPIPNHWTDEQACTFPLGALTCGQGLFQELKLATPDKPANSGEPILIYGGSTATGALGIQLLKLSGYKVITTCSPRNFEYVKSLGADAAFDYNSADCAEQIKKAADGKLMYAWDCIALPDKSVPICADALESGGHYASLLPLEKFPRDDVSNASTLLYSVYGEAVDKPFFKTKGKPEDYEFGVKFANILRTLIKEDKIKVHKPKVMDGGIDGIMEGLSLLQNDKVSGEKLVYKL
jgi:NADPH:quinone reductase-like Zn-dependent oxidoreductase